MELFNVEQAADFLGVSVHFIRRLVREKRVRYLKLGPFVRLTREDLEAFALSHPVEPRPTYRP